MLYVLITIGILGSFGNSEPLLPGQSGGPWNAEEIDIVRQKVYRGSSHFVISQFVTPAILWFCFRPQSHDFEKKHICIYIFFWKYFWILFFLFFLFVYSDWHLININCYFLVFRHNTCKKIKRHVTVDLKMLFPLWKIISWKKAQ